MIGTVLSVFVLLLAGYGAKKLKILRAEDVGVLNNTVIYLTLPALVFTAIYNFKQPLSLTIVKVPVIGFVIILVAMFVAYAVGKLLKLSPGMLAGFILAAAFGNTGFLGYPVMQAAFADKTALVTAVFYDAFAMSLPLYVLGFLIIAAFAGQKADHTHVIRALKLPQIWAIPVTLVLRQFALPMPLVKALEYLAAGTVPLVMISLGLSLTARSLKGCAAPVSAVCALKMVLLPTLTYFAARFGGITGITRQSMVLEAGMPTAMMAGVIVAKFGEDGEFVAGIIFVTTLLSILTIPATLFILGVHAY